MAGQCDLDDATLALIFSFVELADAVKLEAVCQRWRSICKLHQV